MTDNKDLFICFFKSLVKTDFYSCLGNMTLIRLTNNLIYALLRRKKTCLSVTVTIYLDY